jgi:hypothetical protein
MHPVMKALIAVIDELIFRPLFGWSHGTKSIAFQLVHTQVRN